MSFCPHCHHSVDLTDDLCQWCGALLSATPAGNSTPFSTSRSSRFCAVCKSSLGPDADFCKTCGAVAEPLLSVGKYPTRSTRELNTGDLLDGKYEVLHPMDSGGMGRVYFAYNATLKRYVVIKTLLSEDDPQLVAQSIKEREFLGEFNH